MYGFYIAGTFEQKLPASYLAEYLLPLSRLLAGGRQGTDMLAYISQYILADTVAIFKYLSLKQHSIIIVYLIPVFSWSMDLTFNVSKQNNHLFGLPAPHQQTFGIVTEANYAAKDLKVSNSNQILRYLQSTNCLDAVVNNSGQSL